MSAGGSSFALFRPRPGASRRGMPATVVGRDIPVRAPLTGVTRDAGGARQSPRADTGEPSRVGRIPE